MRVCVHGGLHRGARVRGVHLPCTCLPPPPPPLRAHTQHTHTLQATCSPPTIWPCCCWGGTPPTITLHARRQRRCSSGWRRGASPPSRCAHVGSPWVGCGRGGGLPLPRAARVHVFVCVVGGGGTLFATTRTGRQAGRRLPKAGAPEWALVPSAIHTHTHTPHTHINHPPQEANEDFQAGDPEWALLNYLKAGEMGAELGQSNAAWMLTEGERGGGCRLPAARCRCSLPAAGRSSHPLWC